MLFSRNELKPLLQQVRANDPSLTSLQLSHKRITHKQLLAVSDALRTNSAVTEIWLTHNQISDDKGGGAGSLGYLMEALEGNTSVEEVYLGGNRIGAKGAASLAQLVQRNRTITDLGLEDNAICDGGAKMLADALRHNDTLQTLKLGGNDIQTERTLVGITELLRKNRERAKARFAAEHPELATRKLKKPEGKKKETKGKEGRRRPRSGGEGGRDECRTQRSKAPLTGRRSGSGKVSAQAATGAKQEEKGAPKPLKRGLSGSGGGKEAAPGKQAVEGTFV